MSPRKLNILSAIALRIAAIIIAAQTTGCERAPIASGSSCPHTQAASAASSAPTNAAPAAATDDDALAGPRVGVPDDKANASVTVVNTYCPILAGQRVSSDKRCELRLTREFQGKRVGFCDPTCRDSWDQMPDKQRSDLLAEALALEQANGPGLPMDTP